MSAHEDFSRRLIVKRTTDRSFGLVFVVVFAVIGLWPLIGGLDPRWWALAIAAAVAAAAILAPRVLAPANRLWHEIGVGLQRVVNPLILGLVFYLGVTPTGLVMRLFGKDPLGLKPDPDAESYWIERRPPGPPPDTMPYQF